MLVERARDQTSWTRAAVCRSWMALAVDHRVPMGHWLTVTQLAIGEPQPRPRSTLIPCDLNAELVYADAHPLICQLAGCFIANEDCWHGRFAGRLEDKSANVRKAALQLLATLLLNNPFGPQLPADKFTVSLEEHKQRLKVWLIADCICHSLDDMTWAIWYISGSDCRTPSVFTKEAVTSPVFASAGARA